LLLASLTMVSNRRSAALQRSGYVRHFANSRISASTLVVIFRHSRQVGPLRATNLAKSNLPISNGSSRSLSGDARNSVPPQMEKNSTTKVETRALRMPNLPVKA